MQTPQIGRLSSTKSCCSQWTKSRWYAAVCEHFLAASKWQILGKWEDGTGCLRDECFLCSEFWFDLSRNWKIDWWVRFGAEIPWNIQTQKIWCYYCPFFNWLERRAPGPSELTEWAPNFNIPTPVCVTVHTSGIHIVPGTVLFVCTTSPYPQVPGW